MFCADNPFNEKTRLITGFGLNLQKIWVFPELLSGEKIDSMLFLVGFALVVIVLEVAHEYKLSLFHPFARWRNAG